MRQIVNSKDTLQKAIGLLRETFEKKKYFVMSLRIGKARSIPANSLAHAWYAQVARELKEYTAEQVKCLCKYHLGIPILRGDLDFTITENAVEYNYNELYLSLIDPLPYEDQIKAMVFFPVTRFFTTEQHAEYLTGVQYNYARRGVLLECPDDE